MKLNLKFRLGPIIFNQQVKIVGIAVLLILVSGVALAEDHRQDSNDFFKKDYAKSPLAGKGAEVNKYPSRQPNGSTGLDAGVPSQAEIEKLQKEQMDKVLSNPEYQELIKRQDSSLREPETNQPSTEPKALEESDLTGLSRTVPVKSVGAIINTMDKAHYEKSLLLLMDLADSRKLSLSNIYTIGNYEVMTSSAMLPGIVARGAMVQVLDEVPNGYPVKLSPTYIVKTEGGEILLEAVADLAKYFNKDGQFIEREPRRQPKPAKVKPVQVTLQPTIAG